MRLSLSTLMTMLDYDRPAQKAVKKWVALSGKRPYDKEIAAEWLSGANKIYVGVI